MIDAICGGCGAKYSVHEANAGRTGKCVKCGGAVTVSLPSIAVPSPTARVSRDNADDAEFSAGVQVTTTDSIHGWTITKYRGLVTTHVVAGTGFFSDFAAGFTDVFGG
jgi:hypothetical protein